MSPKAFGLGLGLCLLLSLLGAALYNYTHDFSGLFARDFSVRRQEPNQHFVKMRWLMEEKGAGVQGLALGSSRLGNLDFTRTGDGRRWYNMTYSEGVPAEWLSDLRLLLKAGIRFEAVLLELNEASFRLAPEPHRQQYLRIPYGTPAENAKTYLMYLLRPFQYITGGEWNENIFDIYGTGRPLHPWADEAIDRDPAAHAADPRMDTPFVVPGSRLQETLAEIEAIHQLCVENGIEFGMYLGPTYYLSYLGYGEPQQAELEEFKRRLAAIAPYWDFTGLNPVTENRYYFYEASHYRPVVGDMIIDRIYREDGGCCPPWFGSFVTAAGVEAHLARQRQARQSWQAPAEPAYLPLAEEGE